MRKFSAKQKLAVVIGAGAIAVAATGTAYAFWSSSGTGTGNATTTLGTSSLTITQTSTISDLAPGVGADTISGTVTNNAANSAYVNTVTVSIDSVTEAIGAPVGTCDASDYTLSSPGMAVQKDIASGGSENFTGATLAFNDTTSNQDACKGATVNLKYTSN